MASSTSWTSPCPVSAEAVGGGGATRCPCQCFSEERTDAFAHVWSPSRACSVPALGCANPRVPAGHGCRLNGMAAMGQCAV